MEYKYNLQVNEKYDKEFINLILEIENRFDKLTKHEKLKIESWISKLCIPTINIEWKKDRNLHAILILDMIINNKIESPYNKFYDLSQEIPSLSIVDVKSKISEKFYIEMASNNEEKQIVSNKIEYNSNEILKEKKQLLKESKINLI